MIGISENKDYEAINILLIRDRHLPLLDPFLMIK